MDFDTILGTVVIFSTYSLTWFLLLKSIKIIKSIDKKKEKIVDENQEK